MPSVTLLRSAFSAVRDQVASRRDPVAFARSLGVRVKGRARLVAVNRETFGSEPWLVTLGDNVHIAPEVRFVTHDGAVSVLREEYPDLDWLAPITIGDHVAIGIRAMFMPGVTVGDRCIIGAGALVTRDIPANTVATGVPARVVRSIDDYLAGMVAKSLKCADLPPAEKMARVKQTYEIA